MSQLTVDGIILYSDGGCTHSGHGGWGFHGYTYSLEKPKKGSGNADFYVMDIGYVEKSFFDSIKAGTDPYENIDKSKLKDGIYSLLDKHLMGNLVTPIEYVDYFGVAPGNPDDPMDRSTNNRAEITAFYKALQFCLDKNIKNIHIFSDSEYTLGGFTKALDIWKNSQWVRRDGAPVLNKDLWSLMWDQKQKMQDFTIHCDWIQGHSVFLGNQLADMNATLGRNMSSSGVRQEVNCISPAQGYWGNGDYEKHPLICHTKLFFNSVAGTHIPGTYYLGAVDKDLGVLGKRLSDTSYSVLLLKRPVKELDKLIAYQSSFDEDEDRLVVGHLNNYYKPHIQKQFNEYGEFSLYRPVDYSNSLMSADKLSITEVIDPPKKSMDALLAINNLHQRLLDYLDDNGRSYTLTDLTPHLYETSVVVKKKESVEVSKLKASIKPGVASIAVDANYRSADGIEVILPTVLSFGIDLADRNGLKRIEEFNPKVTLLSWEESPGVFRYFTVIQANDDVGAYCGYYSNVRLNKLPKNKKA